MIIFQYDKTFEGLLTAVFEAYRLKKFPDSIIKEGECLPLFYDETYTVITDDEKAERVWKSLGLNSTCKCNRILINNLFKF
ncbi:hypothetical protein KSX97_06830, partial [Phocaeicola coprocola]|nr:hypothetical protein [Phocaeicola coprocola]MBV4060391.1 hypothetical protein [Phocaeicola coprocola]